VLTHKLSVLDAHLAAARRTRDEVAVTVLDLPVVGRDREDAWARVERLRGRTAAAAFARRTDAGTVAQHRARYAALAELGVSTVFVGVRGLATPEEVLGLAGLND
jgi:alkanesulfonate monooxygenase SsuD/methylene tetrahydromethanopterin reductase-like flavin-dependent oxidoreductase (luciferase family)